MQALSNLRDWIPSIPIPVTEPKWPTFLALNWMTLGVYGPVKNALAFWRWVRMTPSSPAFETRLSGCRVDLALFHTNLIWNKGDRAWRERNHQEACQVLRSVKAEFMQYAGKYDLSFLQNTDCFPSEQIERFREVPSLKEKLKDLAMKVMLVVGGLWILGCLFVANIMTLGITSLFIEDDFNQKITAYQSQEEQAERLQDNKQAQKYWRTALESFNARFPGFLEADEEEEKILCASYLAAQGDRVNWTHVDEEDCHESSDTWEPHPTDSSDQEEWKNSIAHERQSVRNLEWTAESLEERSRLVSDAYADRVKILFNFMSAPVAPMPWQILNLPEESEQATIRTQWKRAALILHPDRVPERNKADAALFFRVVTNAYVNFLRRKVASSTF